MDALCTSQLRNVALGASRVPHEPLLTDLVNMQLYVLKYVSLKLMLS